VSITIVVFHRIVSSYLPDTVKHDNSSPLATGPRGKKGKAAFIEEEKCPINEISRATAGVRTTRVGLQRRVKPNSEKGQRKMQEKGVIQAMYST
jgi:hypothetical protein